MAKLDKIADMTGLYPAAIRQGFTKLDPRLLWRNQVMFVTAVVAAMTTVLGLRDLITGVPGAGSALHIAFWLWLCVVLANFAEALAEGRGRARADTLRATKSETRVRVLADADADPASSTSIISTSLRAGQHVYITAGDIIPTDGDVVRGMASVNESAITGESAPVICESGGDRSSVTGGTTVVSDWIVMRVTAEPGKSFLDRMIAFVEGAERQRTPDEIALNILLVGLTLIFLFVVVTLPAFASYSGTTIPVVVLGALFVTLIPTTIGGLLSAIGIAGMDRLVKANVIAKSGRAVEAAGDVDTLLMDKTGTITFGNRQAFALIPAPGVDARKLAEAAALASLADETPEGKSIVDKAREMLGSVPGMPQGATPVRFTAQTRLSGLDLPDGRTLRKGTIDAVIRLTGQTPPGALAGQVDAIALTVFFTLLTGLAYPLAMTGIAQALVPTAANGSLMMRDGTVIGSTLIAQSFTGAAYLHPRASASSWNAARTGATNLCPTSSILIAQVAERRTAWEAENGTPAPIDAVTTSGSGLDPDISPETAMAQADRIATARKADPAAVRALIEGPHAAGSSASTATPRSTSWPPTRPLTARSP